MVHWHLQHYIHVVYFVQKLLFYLLQLFLVSLWVTCCLWLDLSTAFL